MAVSFKTNLVHVACAYMRMLKVKLTASTLKQRLNENPFFPSLYSLSNTLDRFHILREAFKTDKESFSKSPPSAPFLAWMKNQDTGKDFVLVTAINKDQVSYISDSSKIRTISRAQFLSDFEEIILVAHPDDSSGEKDYSDNLKKEKIGSLKKRLLESAGIFILLSAIFLFISRVPAGMKAAASFITLILLTGVAVTVLLLWYEIDNTNAFVKSICTAGHKTNCNAVLHSKGAMFLGMNWSETGFFYFSASFIFLFFPGITFSTRVFTLALASLISLLYIPYSLYYQWRVVKQWCPLCLSVQAVLAAEFIWASVYFLSNAYIPGTMQFFYVIFAIVLSLAVPVMGWYVEKPLLFSFKNEPLYRTAYKRLLYNPDTFNQLLLQQATAPEGYNEIGITLGNPDAANTIIKVCNPYCGPCARAHPVLHDIVNSNPDVKLKLIFTATNDEKDISRDPARHMLALFRERPEITGTVLDDWYLAEKKDYRTFSKKYELASHALEEQNSEIVKMREWCDRADISFTPTLYINGYRLPEKYDVGELRYLL